MKAALRAQSLPLLRVPLATCSRTRQTDAYVPLPCSPVLLAARLRALVGTAAAGAAARGAAYGHPPERALRLGGCEVDPQTQEARPLTTPGAAPLALTRAECRLLYLLAGTRPPRTSRQHCRGWSGGGAL